MLYSLNSIVFYIWREKNHIYNRVATKCLKISNKIFIITGYLYELTEVEDKVLF